jgi:tetratricopeptide (TPR) repeat protein
LYNYWKFREAGEIAGKGLVLYPEDAWLGIFYMAGLSNTGRFAEALDVARRYVERHPGNPNAWDELGLRYIALGLPDSAEVAFRTSLEVDPGFTYAHYSPAYCLYARGDAMGAVDQIERYWEVADVAQSDRRSDRVSMQHGYSTAMLYAEAGQIENALNEFDKARRYATSPEGLAAIEQDRNLLLLRLGRAEEVLPSARELVRKTGIPYARWVMLRGRARALVALDSLDAARAVIAEIGEAPGAGFARVGAIKATAELALAENRPDDALAVLDSLMQDGLPPLSMLKIEHLETVARAHRMAGRPAEAARVHRDLLRVYGGHALSHYDLGRIYEILERPADAASEFTVFLDMWADADEGLPQVEYARARLGALQAGTP